MNFCSDSKQPKLAVAQSDNIVFVYKWTGTGDSIWEGKKSICNKFSGTSPVTSLVWPMNHPFEVVYGLAEGKVKIGQVRHCCRRREAREHAKMFTGKQK